MGLVKTATCMSCHRVWKISKHVSHIGYICPDCEEHMRRLRTAMNMQQLVQTAIGLGFITDIDPDGMVSVDVSGRPCKFWPLDVEPMGPKKW